MAITITHILKDEQGHITHLIEDGQFESTFAVVYSVKQAALKIETDANSFYAQAPHAKRKSLIQVISEDPAEAPILQAAINKADENHLDNLPIFNLEYYQKHFFEDVA